MSEDHGKYYDFDLRKLQRQTLRDQNIPSHLAPHYSAEVHPRFAPHVHNFESIDEISGHIEFNPFLSKGIFFRSDTLKNFLCIKNEHEIFNN